MRPQERKEIHSCNCQLLSHSGRDLTVFLTYFERLGFATLETELLPQNHTIETGELLSHHIELTVLQ